jgi:hypothetical protein
MQHAVCGGDIGVRAVGGRHGAEWQKTVFPIYGIAISRDLANSIPGIVF